MSSGNEGNPDVIGARTIAFLAELQADPERARRLLAQSYPGQEHYPRTILEEVDRLFGSLDRIYGPPGSPERTEEAEIWFVGTHASLTLRDFIQQANRGARQ